MTDTATATETRFVPTIPADLVGKVRVEPYPTQAFVWCPCPQGYAIVVFPKRTKALEAQATDAACNALRLHQDRCRGGAR